MSDDQAHIVCVDIVMIRLRGSSNTWPTCVDSYNGLSGAVAIHGPHVLIVIMGSQRQ